MRKPNTPSCSGSMNSVKKPAANATDFPPADSNTNPPKTKPKPVTRSGKSLNNLLSCKHHNILMMLTYLYLTQTPFVFNTTSDSRKDALENFIGAPWKNRYPTIACAKIVPGEANHVLTATPREA